ncbi:MAG: FAD-dependent oxidoreductase [Anaerolineae bacterium]|nr:FAD-dependent oxidoreductase [Anaerolineae bacterium]
MPASSRFEVIVIGGGPAGVTAALRACELGARVALVERGSLGGTCTNDGCVPARVLAKAARLIRDAEQLAELELAYPTFTAIVGLAARRIVRELEGAAPAPQWRTLRPLHPRAAEWEQAHG